MKRIAIKLFEYVILGFIVGGAVFIGCKALVDDVNQIKNDISQIKINIRDIAELLECDLNDNCK